MVTVPAEFEAEARIYRNGYNWGRLRSTSELLSYAESLRATAERVPDRRLSDRAYDAGIIAAADARRRDIDLAEI